MPSAESSEAGQLRPPSGSSACPVGTRTGAEGVLREDPPGSGALAVPQAVSASATAVRATTARPTPATRPWRTAYALGVGIGIGALLRRQPVTGTDTGSGP